MEDLKIVIQSLIDVENGKALIKGMSPEDIVETKDLTIAILEHGTANGQTSVMFLLKMPDGNYAMTQITANLFEGLVGAYRGANERFNQENRKPGVSPN